MSYRDPNDPRRLECYKRYDAKPERKARTKTKEYRAWWADYYRRNREKVLAWNRKSKEKPEVKAKTIARELSEKYVEHRRQYWRQPEVRARVRTSHQKRMESDPLYRLGRAVRSRIKRAIDKNYKSGSALTLIGCPIAELKLHLERQWKDGMSWENYGKRSIPCWHIDHIIPLSSFDLTDSKQIEKACHYTNLAPLWAAENRRKSNRYPQQIGGAKCHPIGQESLV